MAENYFATLNSINVNEHTEKKNGLTYLSWAWAWAEVKKQYPGADYTIWKDEKNRPYIFDEKLGYMVFTSVTIEGETKEMWLPVMDNANNAMREVPYVKKTKYKEIEVAAATMFDINTAIMRCLVKNLAMFGLGLYIYAGEDLPEEIETPEMAAKKAEEEAKQKNTYIEVISQLLTETNTDGVKMLEYINEKFKIDAKAFADLNTEQLIFAVRKLGDKKEKAAKQNDAN